MVINHLLNGMILQVLVINGVLNMRRVITPVKPISLGHVLHGTVDG